MVMGATAISGPLRAQPGGQPYVFYGEEPLGGSYLGVDTRDVTPDRLAALHLKDERGVEVTMVDQDAPAGKSGLKEHDVILSVNNQPVESVEQLRRMIREIPAGRTITMGISRDGQPLTVTAQLAQHSKVANMDQDFHFNMPAIHIPPINMPEMDVPVSVVVIHSPSRSGLMVESLTPQLGDFFGVKNGNGVLVRSVEKGSRAEQGGFRAGDVIVKVNGAVVNDAGDFTRLLRGRTQNKASITVMRDRKEQTLTLALPEPRRSGSIDNEDDESKYGGNGAQVAALVPEMMTAEIKRIQPDLARAQKDMQRELVSHRGELKKEMENMQRELRRQQKEIQLQMKRWTKDLEI
jgi:hypothetical protein